MPTTPTRSPELQAGTANWARQCQSLATALQQSHSTAYLQLGWEKHHLMVCSTSVALACCACQALERCRDEPVQTPGDQKHARKDMPNPTAPCRRPHIACAQESSVACVRVLHAGLGADCAWLGQYELQRELGTVELRENVYCLNVSEPELQLVTFYVALMTQLRRVATAATVPART